MFRPSLLIALVAALVPVNQPSPSVAFAGRVTTELRRPGLYGTSRAEWRAQVPGATWRDHRGPLDHPPESVGPQQRGLWCSVATDVSAGVTREVVFYAFRTERPYDCRAEQVRYIFQAGADDREVYSAVAEAMRGVWQDGFSDANELDRAWRAVDALSTDSTPYPSRKWKDLRYWMASTQDVMLFRFGTTVQVLAQSRILSSGLRVNQSVDPRFQRYGVDLETWEVINALRPTDPEAVELILSKERVPDQSLVDRVALRLLRARERAKSLDERGMLTFAAEFVVGRLRVEGEDPVKARPSLAPIVKYGITFQESETDGGIWYVSNSLLTDARRQFAGTRWAKWGPWPSVPEPDVPEDVEYKRVIRNGTAWLARYPHSPHAIAEMFWVAQAYETWWSVSLAPDDEEFVTASEHKEGSDDARRQAIRWYERIIREAPESSEAAYARRVVIQIRVGVDTGQRTFFSPYA